MSLLQNLSLYYPERVITPESLKEIPKGTYMVYILAHNSKAIVVGSGQRNRAKILFDSLSKTTSTHIKALLVRLYTLYYKSGFERFIILCESRDEANSIEKDLHIKIGGNTCEIPDDLLDFLFEDVKDERSILFLKLALCSYYDGLSDLKKWRSRDLIPDECWNNLSEKLCLKELNWV